MSYTAGCRTWKKYEPQKLSLKHVKTMIDRYETTYETEEIDDYENIEEIKYKNRLLSLLSCVLVSIIRCLIPRFTFGSFSILIVVLGAVFPTKFFIYLLIYPFCRLVFGTLYPAYASYKAVRTKNLKEYVKWMMYWIVFALFTCVETFTDVFFSWFPFYYEVKIILVLWLLSPATRGSSILYRKFVHPALCRREQEIDEYISKAKEQGYHTVLNLGTKGVNYATAVIMQTAIKGGGGLVQQLRRSYSLSDLSDGSHCDVIDEGRDVYAGDVIMSNTAAVVRRVNVGRRGFSPRRSASESNSRSAIYFSELDCNLSNSHGVDVNDFGHIKSSEDISSGYSSADNNSVILSTTNSIGVRTRSNTSRQHAGGNNRNTFTNVRRPQPAEGITYVEQDMFESYPNQITPIYRISQTNPPFLLECIGDRVKIVQVLGESNYVVGCDDEFVDTEDEAGEILRNLTSDVRVGDSICDAGKKNNDVDKIVEVRLNQCVDKSEAIDKIVEFDACSEITVDISTVELVVPSAPTLSEIEETKAIHLNRELVSEKNCGVIDSSKMNDTENIYPSEVLEMLKNEDESVAQLGCLPASIISSNDKISLYDSLVNVDSDDEASFGTPEDSPKFKHKVKGGRYGKSKAPSPPKVEDTTVKENTDTLKPSNKKHKRAKSRSPSKRKDSTISKIKHLSGKFAFWNRGDKNVEESDTESESRKSSIDLTDAYYESSSEFKISLTDLNKADSSHFEIDGSSISKEIYDKSDALQRLIEAKLENYAEYRISLHDGTGTSKSTDV